MNQGKNKNLFYILIIFLLYFIVVQDFALSLIYKISGSSTFVKLLIYSKEIIFIMLFAYVVLFVRLPQKLLLAVLLFFVCVMFSGIIALVNGKGVMNIVENIRGVVLLPGFICIGYGIKDDARIINHITKKYMPFLVVCACIGIVEYFLDKTIGTKNFWRNTVGITEFYTDIKGQAHRLVQGFPGNFYGQYGDEFFSVKRLVGIWMGPLTAGYALFIPSLYYFILIFFKNKYRLKYFIALFLILFAIYLTHTRAIIVVFLFSALAFFVLNPTRRNLAILSVIAIFGLIFAVFNWDKIVAFIFDGSTIGHITSILDSLDTIEISVFGEGFGRYGVSGDVGTENIYLTLIGNMGLMGLSLYVFIAAYSVYKVYKVKDGIWRRIALYVALGYFITGFVSEQLIAYTSIMPFYLLLGLTGKGEYQEKLTVDGSLMVLNKLNGNFDLK